MPYDRPQFTFNQLDKACTRLFEDDCDGEEWTKAIDMLSNWRSSHRYPMNALAMTLRNRVKSIDQDAIIAQRLKRLDSILRKLRRRPSMEMSQMQDVGGCRAIMGGMRKLSELLHVFESRPLKHQVARTQDYIRHPKEDGYRSVHLRYRFAGRASASPWNKLRVEIQMRTKMQHSWATSIETVDAFTGENIKFGSGDERWRRFFSLMGSVHAGLEAAPPVPGTPESASELKDEVAHLANELRVDYLLQSYARIGKHVQGRKDGKSMWYLLTLMPDINEIRLRTFPARLVATAQLAYAQAEQQFAGTKNQAVLVSVLQIADLQKAYPNFFGDTRLFLSSLNRYLGR